MAETIRVLIPEEKVDQRIEELGKKISEDYAGRQIHMICILKGGVFFMCETGQEDYGSGITGLYVRGQLRRRDEVQRSGAHRKRSG